LFRLLISYLFYCHPSIAAIIKLLNFPRESLFISPFRASPLGYALIKAKQSEAGQQTIKPNELNAFLL
jgi:hypothetical protein